jgi:hypothetical protein
MSIVGDENLKGPNSGVSSTINSDNASATAANATSRCDIAAAGEYTHYRRRRFGRKLSDHVNL